MRAFLRECWRRLLLLTPCEYYGCDWSGWCGYHEGKYLPGMGWLHEHGEARVCFGCGTYQFQDVEWTLEPERERLPWEQGGSW